MPGSVVGLSLNYGFAGNVSRQSYAEIENRPVKSDSADIPFGAGVILNTDNTYTLAGATTTAANFAGVAVAEIKQLTTYPTSSADTGGVYKANQPCDVLRRGIVNVKVGRGTPTAGGDVYLRTVANGAFPDSEVGDFEAASDSTNSVKLTNCSWNTGKVDANGIAELKIKTVNN